MYPRRRQRTSDALVSSSNCRLQTLYAAYILHIYWTQYTVHLTVKTRAVCRPPLSVRSPAPTETNDPWTPIYIFNWNIIAATYRQQDGMLLFSAVAASLPFPQMPFHRRLAKSLDKRPLLLYRLHLLFIDARLAELALRKSLHVSSHVNCHVVLPLC